MNARLRVGGFTPLSATDYPGELAAAVFCQGCAWRCAYCHNPHLLARRRDAGITWPDVLRFLGRRRKLLDAVVFSGGEPTLQPALGEAMTAVRALGFKVGLHTAGIHPRRLALVLPLVDWVGMDVKTTFDRYPALTGVAGSGDRARRSMELILESGVAHEFRTTAHPAVLSGEILESLADVLAAHGVRRYTVQEFRPQGCASPGLVRSAAAGYPDAALLRKIAGRIREVAFRPA